MLSLNDLPHELGRVLTNFLTLEFVLRLFLSELQKTDSKLHTPMVNLHSLSIGDWVSENPLTNYDTLGKLIKKVNAEIKKRGSSKQVDPSVVKLRDAIANGRIFSRGPDDPISFMKFSKPFNGEVKVTLAVLITPDWLEQQIEHTSSEIGKVFGIARDLGLTCFRRIR
jgi:hypothetical protein